MIVLDRVFIIPKLYITVSSNTLTDFEQGRCHLKGDKSANRMIVRSDK